MDLKSYAVLQKIQGKSDLLKYVVNQTDVPVNVLEQSLRDLLKEQTNEHVESISNNYVDYLQKRIRVGIVPLGDNQFEVSGDINDNELEAIELLTGDSKETVVNNLLSSVLSELRGSKELEIGQLEFTKSEIITPENDVVEELPEPVASESVSEPGVVTKLELSKDDFPPMFEDDLDNISTEHVPDDFSDINFDDIDFVGNAPVEEPVDYDEDAYINGDDQDDSYANGDEQDDADVDGDYVDGNELENDVDEDINPSNEHGKSAIDMAAVRDAYNKAVEAFKEIGFRERADGRLALSV